MRRLFQIEHLDAQRLNDQDRKVAFGEREGLGILLV